MVQGKVKKTYLLEENSRRQTKIAYPDMVAKPPRDIARKQVRLVNWQLMLIVADLQKKDKIFSNF